MVKEIIRDPLFLRQKSEPATEADKQVIIDLMDTLRANLDRCVGMAANMIGVKKQIIVVTTGPIQFAMVNPVIVRKTGKYETQESCLSLEGSRPCVRHREIDNLINSPPSQHRFVYILRSVGRCNYKHTIMSTII